MHICIIIFTLFIVIYKHTKNYNLSLFLSLITLYNYTFHKYLKLQNINYKYNVKLFIYSIILSFAIYFNKSIKINNKINFILLFYLFGTISEYLIHKYIMHANKNKLYYKILHKIPLIKNILLKNNKVHINHHLNIKKNMNLKKNKKYGMYMGWNTTILGIIVLFIILTLSTKFSNYKLSFNKKIIISIITSFMWNYIWNKTHPQMHNYKSDFSIKNGPHDNNLLDLTFITNILYKNHQNHHLQKGKRKGNYNVILLGADEWFGQNNIIIKN